MKFHSAKISYWSNTGNKSLIEICISNFEITGKCSDFSWTNIHLI